MAKYEGSPYGILRGKLGPTVAVYYHGKKIVRAYRKHKVRGSRSYIRDVMLGKESRSSVSVRQANFIRISGILGHLASLGRRVFIYPCWWELAAARNYAMNAQALFFKRNVSFFYSVPNRNEFISPTNSPDIGVITLTDGLLEAGDIIGAEYLGDKIKVEWNKATSRNGSGLDEVYLYAIYWRFPDSGAWYGCLTPWDGMKLYHSKGYVREDGVGYISVESGLDARYFVVYVSFYNRQIGYSISRSFRL